MGNMRKASLGLVAIMFGILLGVAPVSALPIISIDMDPMTAGIQSTLTVALGDSFTVDVVLTGDGFSTFDTVILDVAFNDAGPVLGLGLGPTPGAPTAGALAGTAPLLALDTFGGTPVVPGGALTPDGIPIASGFTGGIGGIGLVSLGLPFATVAAGVEIDIFSLSFLGSTLGTSTISLVGFPLGAELVSFGTPVLSSLASGSVTVAPVPEPSTMILLGSGLVGLIVWRRKRLTQA